MLLKDIRIKAAFISVISNTTLTLLKLAVGLYIHSISIISEAIHSGFDLIASMIALYSVSAASKPPDNEHPYGHGKIENVSGTIEAIFIFIAAAFIIAESIKKIISNAAMKNPLSGFCVMAFSVIINIIISRYLFRIAKKTDSLALEADAQHLASDVYTSIGVFGGLLLVQITQRHIFDPLVAIGVAILILKISYNLTKKSFGYLLDKKLPDEEEEKIKFTILEHYGTFLEFHKLRTRKSGRDRYIELHLVVCKRQNISEAHNLCHHLEKDINEILPHSNVIIHLEPCEVTIEKCKECYKNEEMKYTYVHQSSKKL